MFTGRVASSIIPEESGLPLLQIPSDYPDNPFQRVLLSWIIAELDRRVDGHLSRREVQGTFNRSGGDVVSKHLKALVKDGWIRVRKPSVGMEANHYEYGRRLMPKSVNRASALHLASTLFGDSGLLTPLMSSAAIGTNFLGTNGLLVLGILRCSSSKLSPLEIFNYAPVFMARSTIDNRLKKLLEAGLVVEEDKYWSLTTDFDRALTKYETESGAIARFERNQNIFKVEREKLGLFIKNGKLTHAEETHLKKERCICCGKNKGKMEIEHFPPRHWGGYDHIDLCWGIHKKCNNNYSNKIKKYKLPELDKSIQITLDENTDIRQVVVAVLETSIKRFYKAFDEGRDEEAVQVAAHATALWRAVVEQSIPIRVKRLRNGVPKPATYTTSGRAVRKSTGEIGERFISSELMRDWPEGPARSSIAPRN